MAATGAGPRGLETRVPPPVVMLLCAALMWALRDALPGLRFDFPLRWLASLVLLACGPALVLSAMLEFRRVATTINPLHPERSTALVCGGVFRLTRNPMYLGLACVLVAWGTFLGNALAFAVLPLYVGWITRFQIRPEERAMRALFGAAYDDYASRVRRWL